MKKVSNKHKPATDVYNMLANVEEGIRVNAEQIADDIFNKYIEVAINNDMSQTLFATDYYKYYPNKDNVLNTINELGLMLAYDKIKQKSKHCSLIRLPDEGFDRFCLEASNIPLKVGNSGKCLIYGIK